MDGFQERKWFVYQNDHHEGPFSLEELQGKMGAGEVSRTQYVWCEGMADWQIMSAVREFEALVASPRSTDTESGATQMFQIAPAATDAGAEPSAISVAIEPEPLPEASPVLVSIDTSPETEAAPITMSIDSTPVTSAAAGPSSTSAPSITIESQPRSSGFLKFFLVMSIVFVGAYGYMAGYLDPIVKSPAFVRTTGAIRGVIQPGLSKVAQWVPPLQMVFSPIGEIEGVLPEELSDLRAAAISKVPGAVSVAIRQDELLAPTFYLASNLPNGTVLNIEVTGVPETLLSQTALTAKTQASIDQMLAKSEPLRQADARPLVLGQYTVMVSAAEDAKQSPEARAALAQLPEGRLNVKKTYFLGGKKDNAYAERLKEYHDRLRTKSTDELRDIRQYLSTLEFQLKASNRDFDQASANKNPKAAAKFWNGTHGKWTQLQTQLESAFSKWTEGLTRAEYFHAALYEMTRNLGDSVSQLHTAQHAILTNRAGNKPAEALDPQRRKTAEDALNELKTRLELVEKMPPTENGMPQR